MPKNSQHGGTLLGLILGLVIGLGVALGVAVYVTKVPTPFSNKNQTRSADQDAAENQKNKEWNPNGVLQPKPAASTPTAPTPSADERSTDKATADTPRGEAKNEPKTEAKSEAKPAVTADPSAEGAKPKVGLTTPAGPAAGVDPFQYFVQVGAFRYATDADTQKAKLAMMGLDAKVSEREQGGRNVFRVRLGPFEDKASAERTRNKLEASSLENTLVRVQR